MGLADRSVHLTGRPCVNVLTASENKSLNHVLKVTKHLQCDDIARITNSTWPIISTEEGEFIGLVQKAIEYDEKGLRK